MKAAAIQQFTDAVKAELTQHFPVAGHNTAMGERVEQMQQFIAVADEKFSDLYFQLLEQHEGLTEEDLDMALATTVQAHFGI